MAIRVNRIHNRTNRVLIRVTLGAFECIRVSRAWFLKLLKSQHGCHVRVWSYKRSYKTVWDRTRPYKTVYTTVHSISCIFIGYIGSENIILIVTLEHLAWSLKDCISHWQKGLTLLNSIYTVSNSTVNCLSRQQYINLRHVLLVNALLSIQIQQIQLFV